jgi:hypothetical protein
VTAAPESKPTPPPPREGSTSGGGAGRVVGLVLAAIVGLVGLVLLVGGLGLVALHLFDRDDDGYYTSDTERLETNSYAIATDEIDLRADPLGEAPEELLGTVRIRAEAADGESVFVGIGTQSEVDAYLRGVGHVTIADFGEEIAYDDLPGGAPRRPPGAEDLWIAQAEGEGEQSLSWDAEGGVWSAVVMNADAARGVAVDADAGVEVEYLIWGGLILTVLGLVLLAVAVIAGRAVTRRASHDRPPER